MLEIILGMGLPMVSSRGIGAVSYRALPLLHVCITSGWGDGGACFPPGFSELGNMSDSYHSFTSTILPTQSFFG